MSGKTRSALKQMPDEFLACRSENHVFIKYNDHDLVTRRGVLIEWQRTSKCERCGYDRTQIIDAHSFSVEHARPHYPDGYLSSEGRLYRPEIRREQMRRSGVRVSAVKEIRKKSG